MSELSECPDFHYTPKEIAEQLITDIHFKETDITLEPCKGRNNHFYDLIPYEKDWCEIDEGRDFFNYDFKGKTFSKVITNPPYKSNHTNPDDIKNICMPFILKCLELCDDECWLLLNSKMLNSLTPLRLDKIKNLGFGVSYMKVLNIKCWYGRYYWLCFKKGSDTILNYNL